MKVGGEGVFEDGGCDDEVRDGGVVERMMGRWNDCLKVVLGFCFQTDRQMD